MEFYPPPVYAQPMQGSFIDNYGLDTFAFPSSARDATFGSADPQPHFLTNYAPPATENAFTYPHHATQPHSADVVSCAQFPVLLPFGTSIPVQQNAFIPHPDSAHGLAHSGPPTSLPDAETFAQSRWSKLQFTPYLPPDLPQYPAPKKDKKKAAPKKPAAPTQKRKRTVSQAKDGLPSAKKPRKRSPFSQRHPEIKTGVFRVTAQGVTPNVAGPSFIPPPPPPPPAVELAQRAFDGQVPLYQSNSHPRQHVQLHGLPQPPLPLPKFLLPVPYEGIPLPLGKNSALPASVHAVMRQGQVRLENLLFGRDNKPLPKPFPAGFKTMVTLLRGAALARQRIAEGDAFYGNELYDPYTGESVVLRIMGYAEAVSFLEGVRDTARAMIEMPPVGPPHLLDVPQQNVVEEAPFSVPAADGLTTPTALSQPLQPVSSEDLFKPTASPALLDEIRDLSSNLLASELQEEPVSQRIQDHTELDTIASSFDFSGGLPSISGLFDFDPETPVPLIVFKDEELLAWSPFH